jgi:hypothetical protein
VGYLYTLIIGAVLISLIHFYTEFSKKQKIIIISVFLSFLSFAYIYNTYQDIQREKMLDIVIKYKQGKTVKCKNYDVNSTNFSLSIGTYTFIGKENTPYYSIMISAYNCK